MNPKHAGQKPKLTATKTDRKDLKERVDAFNSKQADLAPLQDKPPDNLDKYAAKLWRFLVPELKKYGQIRAIDRPNLELLCLAYSSYRMAQDTIETYGPWLLDETGVPVRRSPALAQISEAAKIIKSLSADLGLNFNARASQLALSAQITGDKKSKTPFSEVKF